MNRSNIYKLFSCVCALTLCAACNYEEINTDQTGMTTEEGLRDGFAMGGKLITMQRSIFSLGTQADDTRKINTYQTAHHLSMDTWSGFFGQNNDWNGNSHPTYYMRDGWLSSTYSSTFTDVLAPWKSLKEQSEKTNSPEIFALAQILKISSWHKALESFGPIPYSHAAEPVVDVPFDSEREVYTAMFADLVEAITVLTPKAQSGVQIMSDFDIVYSGDAKRWVRYANSLLLRLAMRVRYADENLSKTYVQQALNHPLGVMTDKADEAQVSVGAGLVFRNSIHWMATSYNETRMGSSIYSYLMGYQDPRLSAYFLPVAASSTQGVVAFDGKSYQAVPAGHRNGQNQVYEAFSMPNIKGDTPTYWMRASEVYFLRAEAALVWGAGFGDAEALYRAGVAMSFREHGIDSSVDAYLGSGNVPMAHQVSGAFGGNFGTPRAVIARYEGSQEERLEKIMIQKWLALYPNGTEAWTEWRRTGYPSLNPVQHNEGAALGATIAGGVRRLIYPSSFQATSGSRAVYEAALDKLGGADRTGTRLWWDCNPRVNF